MNVTKPYIPWNVTHCALELNGTNTCILCNFQTHRRHRKLKSVIKIDKDFFLSYEVSIMAGDRWLPGDSSGILNTIQVVVVVVLLLVVILLLLLVVVVVVVVIYSQQNTNNKGLSAWVTLLTSLTRKLRHCWFCWWSPEKSEAHRGSNQDPSQRGLKHTMMYC